MQKRSHDRRDTASGFFYPRAMTRSSSARRRVSLAALLLFAVVGLGSAACSGKSGNGAAPSSGSSPSPSKSAPTAMRQWHEGGYAMQVPADWASTYTNYQGSYSFWTIASPDQTESAVVTFDHCSGCIGGQKYVMGQSPMPDIEGYLQNIAKNSGGVIVNSHEVTYNFSPKTPGTIGRGATFVSHKELVAVSVDLTMRPSHSALADQIIASVREAP